MRVFAGRRCSAGLVVAGCSAVLAAPAVAQAPGELLWMTEIEGDAYACPTVGPDGYIYYATHMSGGVLYKIRASNGAITLQRDLPGVVEHSVALDEDGTLYLNTLVGPLANGGTPEAVAAAYRADDLSELWRTPIAMPGADTSPIVGSDGRIYLGVVVSPQNAENVANCVAGVSCGRYYSFDAATGEVRIDMQTEGWEATPGVIDEQGRVFFGGEDLTGGVEGPSHIWPGAFHAIYGDDPEPPGTEPEFVWPTYYTSGEFGSPVSCVDGVVYTTCRDGYLYGFDADTGDVVLQRDLGAPSWTGCTIGVRPDTGTLVLYTGTQGIDIGRGGQSRVYAIELDGSFEGNLLWWRSVPGGMAFGNPALDDLGNVYYVTSAAVLQAVNPSGDLLWAYDLPGGELGGIGGPAITNDGKVIVAANGGALYAFRASGNHLADDAPWPKYKHDLRNTSNVLTPVRERTIGDVDDDGHVTLADLSELLVHYGTPAGMTSDQGDFDGDGDVDVVDLSALLTNFGL